MLITAMGFLLVAVAPSFGTRDSGDRKNDGLYVVVSSALR